MYVHIVGRGPNWDVFLQIEFLKDFNVLQKNVSVQILPHKAFLIEIKGQVNICMYFAWRSEAIQLGRPLFDKIYATDLYEICKWLFFAMGRTMPFVIFEPIFNIPFTSEIICLQVDNFLSDLKWKHAQSWVGEMNYLIISSVLKRFAKTFLFIKKFVCRRIYFQLEMGRLMPFGQLKFCNISVTF